MATRMATKRMKKDEYWKRKHVGDESTMSAANSHLSHYRRETLFQTLPPTHRAIDGDSAPIDPEQKHTLDGYTDGNEKDEKR